MPPPPPRRQPPSHALAALAAVAALALGARSATAADPPLARLVVHRAQAAADCPDAPALTAAVHALVQRPALDPASTDHLAPVYDIQIFRDDEGYAAILQAGGLTRQLSDPGATCADLAEALALTLAILLDTEASPQPPPPPPPQPPPSPSPSPQPQPSPPRQPQPIAPLPPPPPRPPRVRGPKTWDLNFELGAAQTVGILTPFSWALSAEGSVRLRSGSFGVGAIWMPTRTIDAPPGEVDVSLIAGTLRACAAILGKLTGPRLSLCAAPIMGAIQGAGRGYSPDREGSALWFSLGAAALAEGPIVGPLGWSARANLLVPVFSEEFTVDRQEGSTVTTVTALDPWPVGFLLGAGLRVSIP